jgi:hypothetical protein
MSLQYKGRSIPKYENIFTTRPNNKVCMLRLANPVNALFGGKVLMSLPSIFLRITQINKYTNRKMKNKYRELTKNKNKTSIICYLLLSS